MGIAVSDQEIVAPNFPDFRKSVRTRCGHGHIWKTAGPPKSLILWRTQEDLNL
jgi:hypothetical protein